MKTSRSPVSIDIKQMSTTKQCNSTWVLSPSDETQIKILEERKYVDIKPYSHNLVGLYLNWYAELEGQDKTNQLIINFKLDELGWSPVEEKEEDEEDEGWNCRPEKWRSYDLVKYTNGDKWVIVREEYKWAEYHVDGKKPDFSHVKEGETYTLDEVFGDANVEFTDSDGGGVYIDSSNLSTAEVAKLEDDNSDWLGTLHNEWSEGGKWSEW